MGSLRQLVSICAIFLTWLIAPVTRAQSLPEVSLNADGLAPRPIEELTGTNVTREYATAWESLERSVEQNQTSLLKEHFTGFALDRLKHRIADQQANGLRTQIVDQGHHVKAVFYSQDGGAMQLVDDARMEIQVFDGSRLIDSENESRRYIVLMTPGADRWYVRYLEEEPSSSQ